MRVHIALIAAFALAISAMPAEAAKKSKKNHTNVKDCAAEIERERKDYDSQLKAHATDGKLDDAEKAPLAKMHSELEAMVSKANKDGKLTVVECKRIHDKIVDEHNAMEDAIAGRPIGHAEDMKALAGTGIKSKKDCLAAIDAERKDYDAKLKAHATDGKIDDQERAALDKTHSELEAMVKKAQADGKITAKECVDIRAKIKQEHKQMNDAIGVREKGHAANKKAFAGKSFNSIKGCQAEINKEKATYDSRMKAGIDSGKIDAKEKADIEKTHAELLKLIADANADGKVTAAECVGIHNKVVEENKKINAAVDAIMKRPAAKSKKVSVLKKQKRGKPAKHKTVAACQAEINAEKSTYASDMAKLQASGHLSPAEKADIEKSHKELLALEKRAKADGKITADECSEIHAKIVEEHNKMVEADKE